MRSILAVALCCLAGCASHRVPAGTVTDRQVTFARVWETRNAAGEVNPQTHIDLRTMEGGDRHEFELGEGRHLVVYDHVGRLDDTELALIGDTVRRCYAHIHASTGMKVPGGVIYFLLPLDPANNSYTLSYAVPKGETERWSWASTIAFLPGEGVSRSKKFSLDLYEELLLSTPHELTENLVTSIENFQVDAEDAVSNHTRWFHDGAAEYVSSKFAEKEFPQLWAADRFHRHRIHEVMDEDRIRQSLLGWVGSGARIREGTGDRAGPLEQYLMYGAAELLVEVWTRSMPLPEVLARIQAHDGPVDGEVLLAMVEKATGMNRDQFLEAARQCGRSQAPREQQSTHRP